MMHLSYCNMFIARHDFVDGYCSWMFDVMGKLEGRISLDGYDTGHKRIYGYFTEVMLNVYVQKHNLRRKYFQPVSSSEKKTKVLGFLKNIPGLRALSHAFMPGRKAEIDLWKRKVGARGESTRRFIAGLKENYPDSICVPDISGLKEYVHFIGFHEIESGTTGKFMYILADTDCTPGNEAVLAVFMPRDFADVDGLPEAVKDVTSRIAGKFGGAVILPEVILRGEAPVSLKEAGIRAIML